MTLPPGFRFHPTDVELVGYYLKKRVKGIAIEFDVIADVDLYKCEPWDLPPKSRLPSNDLEWFFFSPRDRKYPNGSRTNRATETGYWKATGRDRYVKSTGANSKTIGMKKTLVFYMGRAPHGERTDWLMHEYRLDGDEWEATNVSQDAYVLCRVFKKNGLGPPKNPSGNSIDDGVDNADSPGEEKSSVSFDNDVKPNLDLHAPLPLITGRLPGQAQDVLTTVKHQDADEYSSGVPMINMDSFGPDPVLDDSFFIKMDPSSWDFSLFDASNDGQSALLPTYPDSTVDVKNEFKSSWQPGQVGGGDLWENSRNNMQPWVENNYDGLDMLPPLVIPDSPSPPTVQSSYTPYPYDFTETPPPQTIRIRPRLPHAPVSRSPMPGTARQMVKFQKPTQKPTRPAAQDKQSGVSETKGPAEIESKHDKDAKDVTVEASKVPDQVEKISLASSPQVTVGPGASLQDPQDADSEVGPGALSQKSRGDECQKLMSGVPILRLGSVRFQPALALEYSSAEPLKHSKLEGAVEFPSRIGSIHVNAVTITCSCDKVSNQAHVQATVCDCYNSNSKSSNDHVLPGSWDKAAEQNHKEGKSLERRRGVSTRGFACVFVMGTLSACFGFFVMHEFWRATRQVVRNGVHIVSAASDL